MSCFLLTSLATSGEAVVRTGFSGKVFWTSQQIRTATQANFEVFGEEYIGDYFFVLFRRVVDARDDTLAEYCGDVVWGVGFVVFVIDMPGNVGVFDLAQFHVKYFTMYVG